MDEPKPESVKKMWNYAEKFAEKSGTHLHPDRYITEGVVLGPRLEHRQLRPPSLPLQLLPFQG